MAPASYSKPYLTIDAQLELLKSRGMTVADEARAKAALHRIGYYRLSGYWYPFRRAYRAYAQDGKFELKVSDDFRGGIDFSHPLSLYVFDKKLRMLLLDAIERIEVAIRVDIALLLGKRDPCAHRNGSLLHGNFAVRTNPRTQSTPHTEWLRRHDEVEKRSKEDFIKHFRSKYSGDPPIWIAIELWDFGMLSVFFSGMTYADKSAIATRYNVNRPELFESWLRGINFVRNSCAHHSRTWNRTLVDQPKLPKIGEIPVLDHLASDTFAHTRLYCAVALIKYLLKFVNPRSSWGQRFQELIGNFPAAPSVSYLQMGIPEKWLQLELWQAPAPEMTGQ